MKGILKHIEQKIEQKKKQIALLIDPEKCSEERIKEYLQEIKKALPDYLFVGGSQLQCSVKSCVEQLKACKIPIILFPGNAMQLTDNANGLLLLSLLSGRNAEYLIGQHVKAASLIKQSGIEVIPTGYILVNGGKRCEVQSVSGTESDGNDEYELAANTAVGGDQ